MKTIVLVLALLAAAAQEPWTEPPEYPPGQFCSTHGIVDAKGGTVDGAHPCHCRPMADPSSACENVQEDWRHCDQGCHKGKCKCPVVCERPKP